VADAGEGATGIGANDCLYLFTSSVRELYVDDAVTAMAAPHGMHLRFRYDAKYVAEALRVTWRANGLVGRRVACLFSLQHPRGFYKATFAPVRGGTVISSRVEGDIYVVDFAADCYLSLPEPSDRDQPDYAEPVLAFSTAVHSALPDRAPNKISASYGPDPTTLPVRPLQITAETTEFSAAFTRCVSYLHAMLPGSRRAFWRIVEIRAPGGGSVGLDKGTLSLTASREYVLEILHFHPEATPDKRITVTAPPGVDILGDVTYEIRSRYDLVPIRLYARPSDTKVAGELRIVTGDPKDPDAPSVGIPTVVGPTATHIASGPVLGVGGAIALALPAALNASHHTGWSIGLAVLGSTAVGVGLWFRRFRGLSA